MRFGLRGLARAEGSTILGADLAAEGKEAGTYRSPFLKHHGPRSTRRLLDRLTAQQSSLARSVALGDDDYLDRSYYEDPASGKHIAYELEHTELTEFSASWKMKPVSCIRAMNRAIGRIAEPGRKERYVRAAVDLEILMDRQSRTGPAGRVHQGIPEYLMNGYTDMGSLSSVTERNGREKIKVDKEHVRGRLVACKRRMVTTGALEDLLAQYYRAVRRDIKFNERGVDKLLHEYGDRSIATVEIPGHGAGGLPALVDFLSALFARGRDRIPSRQRGPEVLRFQRTPCLEPSASRRAFRPSRCHAPQPARAFHHLGHVRGRGLQTCHRHVPLVFADAGRPEQLQDRYLTVSSVRR